ncbi:MAG: hypothetical protein A2004_09730 [Spirochaetes bacterium GWC1_61_12]|nr:MAG: hypothetical protein A2Y37_10960 [Spirochaetes bacterium GWB1_60_80]OHD33709.1 MAG: hypothetical protein A2004_09730 [Spirochaetes bacterium GWC1_61_12]OHD44957.1 MAG: hypothetical protein A2Y35_13000 [Spirochaetes bacterium GWE1_60_18]OHD60067.1 MAG: hypothetical protein A2Y32_11115 [Spirochaetes bacterium GWF1_60_12]HAP43628.1 hypothetical protein [Spirochaetaceae bacterium]
MPQLGNGCSIELVQSLADPGLIYSVVLVLAVASLTVTSHCHWQYFYSRGISSIPMQHLAY